MGASSPYSNWSISRPSTGRSGSDSGHVLTSIIEERATSASAFRLAAGPRRLRETVVARRVRALDNHQAKADRPVIARPTIRAWTVSVPSNV
jgi:hypothetical protein